MQKTHISLAIFTFVIVSLFGFVKDVSAQTYFVDLTGSGCNQSCQQLLTQYFSTNTSTSTNSNSTSTRATSTSSTWYPYQQYVNFETTNSYYNTGRQQGNPYAYQAYTYFNNPTYTAYNPKPSYANQFYTYYGSDANEQLKKYQQITQPVYSTYTTQQTRNYVPQNSGFTLTSGF